ncbi:MAG: phage shock protein operon transcriptional activator [Pseudomonadota bacterium]
MAIPKDHERLIGEAPAFLAVLDDISRMAPLEKPVLVVGERGTGKELIAARLHYLSNRWEGAYQKVNCAAISETLLESELFGHEAGSFTGATRAHKGRFERADGGTLFLDELATTSPAVQEKLLRVIEYGEFERLGGQKTLSVDVRLVAATNVDLPAKAAAGEFRYDLLDRLAFDVVTLPPLRERQEDILLLAQAFAINMASELERELFPGFSAAAAERLVAYDWPGNVRELKNVVERSVYRAPDNEEVDEIIIDAFDSPWRPRVDPAAGDGASGEERGKANGASGAADGEADGAANGTKSGADLPAAPSAQSWPLDLRAATTNYEIGLIEAGMAEARFNQRKAAELLGLTYDQLRGLLKKHDLLANKE